MPRRGSIHLEGVSILFELVRQMAHARRYRREPFLDDLAYLLCHLTHHARRALRLGQSAPPKIHRSGPAGLFRPPGSLSGKDALRDTLQERAKFS